MTNRENALVFPIAHFYPNTGSHFSECAGFSGRAFNPKTGSHFSGCALASICRMNAGLK